MGIEEEVDSFIEQTIKKYEEAGFKIRGSYWEKQMIETFRDFYLQLKYICEEMKREFIIEHTPDFDKSMTVHRIGNILLKIMFQPWYKNKELTEKPQFTWQKYNTTLNIDEYVDTVLHLTSSAFEYYYSFVKNNVIFNCTNIARELGLDDSIISQIAKPYNLKEVYDKLSEVTKTRYGINTNSFFPDKFIDVRNAVFHMDYYYEKLPSTGNFKIYLDKGKTKEILFSDLIKLIHEVIPKINTIKVIPYYFASPKSTLPLQGFDC